MNPEQFAAWLNGSHQSGARRLDARETAVLTKMLEFVESRTYDIQLPELKARRFIPTDTSVPNGAETITYRQWDQFGMAKIIANYADDFPRVDVVAKEFTTQVKSLGDSYGYSVQDLRAAAMSGQPLDEMRARAARRAIEAAIDEIAAFGLSAAGLEGFLNHSNVPVTSVVTGTWASATALQILGDMNALAQAIVTATKEIYVPDTLLVDNGSFAILSQTFMSADNNKTVLAAFLENNPYVRNVDQWSKLNLADAAGTGPRLMAYARNPEVCELKIPQDFEQFPPEPRNLEFVVNCHARCGGVVWRYPLAASYMDGI